MPDGKNYELVDGHLVERNMSQLSSWVGGELTSHLDVFVRDNPIGWAWPADLGYECFPDAPARSGSRTSRSSATSGCRRGSPRTATLTSRPTSPSRSSRPTTCGMRSTAKVDEYLDAGVPLVWVIDPEARTVHVYRRDGTVSLLREDG